jgi:hypothetical protein
VSVIHVSPFDFGEGSSHAGAVGHDDMFSLSRNAEANLFERPDRIEMIDAG